MQKNKIIIVNEKDKIIGYKVRDNIKSSDIYRVSALWIKNSKGDILLARRAFTKSHDPGKWGPAVAGTVEEGETYKSNIIKEAREELGLKNQKLRKGPRERVFGEHNSFGQWYLTIIDKDIKKLKIQEDEVAEIKWFTEKELLKRINSHPKDFIRSMKRPIKLFKLKK